MNSRRWLIYASFGLFIGCGMPNYIPPVSYSYYPDKKVSGNIGLSLLAGLYLSGSVNIEDAILLTPNINFLGFNFIRVGMGIGKSFSLLKEKYISFNIIPSFFTNIINFKGMENKQSPRITGIEIFPDLQISFNFPIFEIFVGLKGIMIPYAIVRWTDEQTGQSWKERYSDPLHVFLPATYAGVSIGKYVYANGGITFLPTIPREEIERTKISENTLKEKLDIAPLTINIGLRFIL